MLRTQRSPDLRPEIRPASRPDSGDIREFINGLSVRTQLLRFSGIAAPPSSGMLRALSGTDCSADIVIATYRGSVIGHAMAVDRRAVDRTTGDRADGDGIRASDIGLVVADSWQLHGVGSALLGMLVSRAAGRGVGMLVMDVRPGNGRMLAMIERRWPGARREVGADFITISAGLDPVEGDYSDASLTAA
jgi:GNAT superfamily N-acetyltransferase